MNIRRLNDTLWAVDSESTDRSYSVNLTGNGSCSCPHFAYRLADLSPDDPGRCCKHMAAVRAYVENLQPPTALEKASAKAAGLTDEQLLHWAKAKGAGAEAAACWLELAARKLDRDAAKTEPKPVPAGVECFLQGATEAERERALRCYR